MYQQQFGVPGQTAAVSTVTNEFIWGGDVSKVPVLQSNEVISGAARDAGASPTSVLRPGLIVGRIAASGKIAQWNPAATDGTQNAVGILPVELVVVDWNGSNVDKLCPVVVWAPIKAANLYILGAAFVGHASEYLARRQLAKLGFRFDDDKEGFKSGQTERIAIKATNYTVVAADNGTNFQAITADATFTLPTLIAGLKFSFLRVDDFELVVASAAGDDMVVGNDVAADSITFTTAGQQIGAQIVVESAYVNGTLKWVATLPYIPFGTGTATLAFAIGT